MRREQTGSVTVEAVVGCLAYAQDVRAQGTALVAPSSCRVRFWVGGLGYYLYGLLTNHSPRRRAAVKKTGIVLIVSGVVGVVPSMLLLIRSATSLWPFYVSLGFFLIGWILFAYSSDFETARAVRGPLVIGVVESVKNTGWYSSRVGGVPEVEVVVRFQTPDGRWLTGSGRKFPGPTDLSRLQPGMTVPVRYNPKKPQSLMLDLDADLGRPPASTW